MGFFLFSFKFGVLHSTNHFDVILFIEAYLVISQERTKSSYVYLQTLVFLSYTQWNSSLGVERGRDKEKEKDGKIR